MVATLNGAGDIPAWCEVVVGVPSIHIGSVMGTLRKDIAIAAQDCSATGMGAYTGELSAAMLADYGVKWVILDHISILVSGLATNDERKLIDMVMTKLATLTQELQIGLIVISHLRRPEGDKGHEDGAKVRLGQLRGSHAVAQLSSMCISLQIDPDNPDGDTRHLHVLKNRFTGETGFAGSVGFNRHTGRLTSSQEMF